MHTVMLLHGYRISRKTLTPLALVCGLLLFSQLSFTRPDPPEKLSPDDESFVKDAAQNGMAEVQLAKLALQKSARPSVKQFAQRVVADQTQANSQLNSLAAAKHIDLPDGIGLKNGAEKARLTILSGKDFDYAYVNAMVDDHKSDLEKFQKEASRDAGPDIKQFVGTTLPMLKERLQMIQTTQGDMLSTNRKIDGKDR